MSQKSRVDLQTQIDTQLASGGGANLITALKLRTVLTHIIDSCWNILSDTLTVAWADITGKPSTFAPDAHTHATSEVTGLDAALAAKLDASGTAADVNPAGTSIAAALAGKLGTGAQAADVNPAGTSIASALAGKANTVHGHTISDVGGLQTALDGKAASSHTHSAADITSGSLDGDRLAAPSSTKRGGVKATGTPSGKFLKDDDTWAMPACESFDPGWDGQGQVISGEVILVPVAITQTLTQAALVADVSGSVTVTVKKYTPSGGALGSPSTLGTVALSSAVHTRSTGLSWAVTAGDVLEFTPSSITSVKRLRAKLAA